MSMVDAGDLARGRLVIRKERPMAYVLRLVQFFSFPPLIPVSVVLHDGPQIEAWLAGVVGPLMFGLTSLFILATELIERRRGMS